MKALFFFLPINLPLDLSKFYQYKLYNFILKTNILYIIKDFNNEILIFDAC